MSYWQNLSRFIHTNGPSTWNSRHNSTNDPHDDAHPDQTRDNEEAIVDEYVENFVDDSDDENEFVDIFAMRRRQIEDENLRDKHLYPFPVNNRDKTTLTDLGKDNFNLSNTRSRVCDNYISHYTLCITTEQWLSRVYSVFPSETRIVERENSANIVYYRDKLRLSEFLMNTFIMIGNPFNWYVISMANFLIIYPMCLVNKLDQKYFDLEMKEKKKEQEKNNNSQQHKKQKKKNNNIKNGNNQIHCQIRDYPFNPIAIFATRYQFTHITRSKCYHCNNSCPHIFIAATDYGGDVNLFSCKSILKSINLHDSRKTNTKYPRLKPDIVINNRLFIDPHLNQQFDDVSVWSIDVITKNCCIYGINNCNNDININNSGNTKNGDGDSSDSSDSCEFELNIVFGSNTHYIRTFRYKVNDSGTSSSDVLRHNCLLFTQIEDNCGIEPCGNNVPCVSFSKDLNYIASVSIDGCLYIWKYQNNVCSNNKNNIASPMTTTMTNGKNDDDWNDTCGVINGANDRMDDDHGSASGTLTMGTFDFDNGHTCNYDNNGRRCVGKNCKKVELLIRSNLLDASLFNNFRDILASARQSQWLWAVDWIDNKSVLRLNVNDEQIESFLKSMSARSIVNEYLSKHPKIHKKLESGLKDETKNRNSNSNGNRNSSSIRMSNDKTITPKQSTANGKLGKIIPKLDKRQIKRSTKDLFSKVSSNVRRGVSSIKTRSNSIVSNNISEPFLNRFGKTNSGSKTNIDSTTSNENRIIMANKAHGYHETLWDDSEDDDDDDDDDDDENENNDENNNVNKKEQLKSDEKSKDIDYNSDSENESECFNFDPISNDLLSLDCAEDIKEMKEIQESDVYHDDDYDRTKIKENVKYLLAVANKCDVMIVEFVENDINILCRISSVYNKYHLEYTHRINRYNFRDSFHRLQFVKYISNLSCLVVGAPSYPVVAIYLLYYKNTNKNDSNDSNGARLDCILHGYYPTRFYYSRDLHNSLKFVEYDASLLKHVETHKIRLAGIDVLNCNPKLNSARIGLLYHGGLTVILNIRRINHVCLQVSQE